MGMTVRIFIKIVVGIFPKKRAKVNVKFENLLKSEKFDIMKAMTKSKFLIKGLGGKKSLSGVIGVNGAKNAALKLMAASILFKGEIMLKNIPDIEDIKHTANLLDKLGFAVKRVGKRAYKIKPTKHINYELSRETAKRLRASIVLVGPILARLGKVKFPHPGGCVIGKRPIDFFLDGFKKMGARVVDKNGSYFISTQSGKLKGAEILLRVPSVTGTETFMMAGTLAKGTTIIKNAAMEPEIVHLAEFLVSSGAKISGAGTPTITIKGGGLLSRKKAYTAMPDRIEAGSFLILGALAAKDLLIKNCNPDHLEILVDALRSAGIKIDTAKNSIRVRGLKNNHKPLDIKTHEYPGFPTDLQAPMTIFLTQAAGESFVFETIFEGRLNYTESLVTMGADIKTMDPHRIIVKGPSPLHGKVLESPDLRAGLAFVLAAIIASGNSVVHNVRNIDRGYERVEERLRKIGVDIARVDAEEVRMGL